ncbi:hypothetical protein M9H77_09589 [Catharanthus roseus]|uniref:Uncharacterized protein n=1 Tax=Catharanthus roseus TaxID=4058 RepID=A0ACC0C187_CATRO|nr:hypothetical protein M9H77_09589 [Catharanthus roseus]
MIKHTTIVDSLASRGPILLLKVSSNILAKNDIDIKAFVSELVNDDEETLFGLLVAANYLDINGLLFLACEDVSDMDFNITPDFSLEEEGKMRRENPWAFN